VDDAASRSWNSESRRHLGHYRHRINSSLNPAEKWGSIQRFMENVRLIAVTGQFHFVPVTSRGIF
jgi:hypothetical protein